MEAMFMSLESYIHHGLKEQKCTAFSPSSTYAIGENIPIFNRSSEQLTSLENTISQTMIELYQQSLIESLGKEIPILYIDCNKKGDSDISTFIAEECIKRSTIKDKLGIFGNLIAKGNLSNGFEVDSYDTIESLTASHKKTLKVLLNGLDEARKNIVRLAENSIKYECLAAFMKGEEVSKMYLYLDNTACLTRHEAQHINNHIFCGGTLGYQKGYIYIKINDGKKRRKTWMTSDNRVLMDMHDYSHRYIALEERDDG